MAIKTRTAARAGAKPSPTAAGLLATVKRLTPLLSAQADANEAHGRLSDETVAALVDNDIHKLWIPRCFGGAEAWPLEALEVIEALSYADGSTGWVLMAWEVAMSSAAAYLPPTTADKLFTDATPIIGGQGSAIGRAEVVPGGYRLTGHWRYASGLLHGSYIHTGAAVHVDGKPLMTPGTDQPEARIFILPVTQAKLLGNWEVMGLRATGSVDYEIDDVFVPEEFTHIQQARYANRGDVYRLGISGMGAICHSGFALGVGRRVLDEIAALASATPSKSGLITERGGGESFREQYGAAEARFRAARAFVREAQGDVQAAVQRGEEPSTRQVTMVRLSLNHVTSVVADVCEFAYRFAGGHSLRPSVIQRCLRDMYAGTQHATTAPAILRECGRELLGIAPGMVWGGRGLVPPPVTV